MVIVRITEGLANGILQFCSGYALARELDDELLLDIYQYDCSVWGYLLDRLSIPTCSKISYETHIRVRDCKSGSEYWPYPVDDVLFLDKKNYKGIESASEFKGKNVVIVDSFFDDYKYFSKYWYEIRDMLRLADDETEQELSLFNEIIKNRIPVGIHIRRGDMLKVDYSIDIIDDYYRTSIVYLRSLFGKKVLFLVFSDDIDYAMQMLGKSEDIRYIHFFGYDAADFKEFLCLSRCKHLILCNNSTYSSLAEKLHNNNKRIVLYQGDIEDRSTLYRMVEAIKSIAFLGKLSYLFFFDNALFTEYKYRIENRKQDKYVDFRMIKKYASLYHYSSIESGKLPCQDITLLNAEQFLKDVNKIEFNYYSIDFDSKIRCIYNIFKAHLILEHYEKAIPYADYVWGYFKYDMGFRKEYSLALEKAGYSDESFLISCAPNRNITFVVISGYKTHYSGSAYGMGELAIGLSKMGCDVCIVELPDDNVERMYIEENQSKLVSRHGNIYLGCNIYNYEKGLGRAIEKITDRKESQSLVYISRDPKVFDSSNGGGKCIFLDFSDLKDPEREFIKTIDSDDICLMQKKADYIITCDSNSYHADYSDKLIKYDNDMMDFPSRIIKGRWKDHYSHRLNKRVINMCKKIRISGLFDIM